MDAAENLEIKPVKNKKKDSTILETDPFLLRKKLFKYSKPVIRLLTAQDIKWLWAAYKHGSFDHYNLPEMNRDKFEEMIVTRVVPAYQEIFIIEDKHEGFSNKQGPVGMVMNSLNGWRLEPHVNWFKWATKKNILRGTVAYLQHARHRKDVGVIKILSLKTYKNLFEHVTSYLVTNTMLRGKIPHGSELGDEYIFSLKGMKK